MPGAQGYLAAFDGAGQRQSDDSDVWKFHNKYVPRNRQYYQGVATGGSHCFLVNIPPNFFNMWVGGPESAAISHKALHDLTVFCQTPADRGLCVDTVAWSRGSFEAVDFDWLIYTHGIDDWSTKSTINGTVQYAHIAVATRFTGLISPVGQMGPGQQFYWHTDTPPGLAYLAQALDKYPICIPFPETTMGADKDTQVTNKRFKYPHDTIGFEDDVLTFLTAQAKKDGVPVK